MRVGVALPAQTPRSLSLTLPVPACIHTFPQNTYAGSDFAGSARDALKKMKKAETPNSTVSLEDTTKGHPFRAEERNPTCKKKISRNKAPAWTTPKKIKAHIMIFIL